MCRHPALAGCCGGALHCAGHMAIEQSALPAASKHVRGAIACERFWRGCGWSARQCHSGSVGIDAAEGELLSGIVAGLLEGVVKEATVVAVVVLDLHTVFGGEGLEDMFGCYGIFG